MAPMTWRDVHGVKLIEEHDRVIEDFTRRGLPTFEPESMAAWLEAVTPGQMAIDVGAYTGVYAIAAAKQGAYVEAFEPNPDAYRRLVENVELNRITDGLMFPRQLALGSGVASGSLESPETPLTSASRVRVGEGPVRVVALDGRPMPAPISAIKIDVEGAEIDVMLGALRKIHCNRPLLIVEALTNEDRVAVTRFVEALGYTSVTRADERNLICRAC